MSENDFVLNKKIAKLRHCHTIYNKNMDLMYDAEGNQTELRKEINKILYKIASGELGDSYLAGVNSEIKYIRDKIKKEERLKLGIGKRHKKKKEPTVEEQTSALLRGFQKLEKQEENKKQQLYLSKIGMLKSQIQQSYRKALPHYKI